MLTTTKELYGRSIIYDRYEVRDDSNDRVYGDGVVVHAEKAAGETIEIAIDTIDTSAEYSLFQDRG
jgi:hypothetical protein